MKKRVLSVDDDESVLKCMKALLDGQGFDVRVTADPAEALEIIREEELDLVTLDIRMPKITGFDVYKALKEVKRATTPVLFVTAYPGSFTMESESLVEMWQEEFADGNTDILYKPFDLDTFMEKVSALVGPADGGSE